VLKMVHTHEGAAAVTMMLAYGSAKDRKRLAKVRCAWQAAGQAAGVAPAGVAPAGAGGWPGCCAAAWRQRLRAGRPLRPRHPPMPTSSAHPQPPPLRCLPLPRRP
jgi:hypothetical protein